MPFSRQTELPKDVRPNLRLGQERQVASDQREPDKARCLLDVNLRPANSLARVEHLLVSTRSEVLGSQKPGFFEKPGFFSPENF